MAKANQISQGHQRRNRQPSLAERKVSALESIAYSLRIMSYPVEMQLQAAQQQVAQQQPEASGEEE